MKNFLEIIEAQRIELDQIVKKHGLNSLVTLKYSQKLDQLLNQYDQFSEKVHSNFNQ